MANGHKLDPLRIVLYVDDLSEAGLQSIRNEMVDSKMLRVFCGTVLPFVKIPYERYKSPN